MFLSLLGFVTYANSSLNKLCNDKSFVLSMYLNHHDFDEILDESIELSLYVYGKEKTDSLIAISTLKNSAHNIQKLHKPTFENIF